MHARLARQTPVMRFSTLLDIACIAFVVTAYACSAEANDPDYHGETSFVPDERVEVEEGMRIIRERTGHPFSVAWDNGRAGVDNRLTRETPKVKEAISGFYFTSGSMARTIQIAPEVPIEHLRSVAAREFAKATGMKKHPGPGILAEDFSQYSTTWTAEDEAECARVGCRD